MIDAIIKSNSNESAEMTNLLSINLSVSMLGLVGNWKGSIAHLILCYFIVISS